MEQNNQNQNRNFNANNNNANSNGNVNNPRQAAEPTKGLNVNIDPTQPKTAGIIGFLCGLGVAGLIAGGRKLWKRRQEKKQQQPAAPAPAPAPKPETPPAPETPAAAA